VTNARKATSLADLGKFGEDDNANYQ